MTHHWASFALATALCGLLAVAPTRADDAPAPIEVRYIGDLLSDVSGGRHRGTGWTGRLDLLLDRSGRVAGIDGIEAHFDLMLLHGTRFSRDFSGDAQTLSNIDAPRAIRPFEAWVQLPIAAHVRVKAGYIDLNSEFDVQSVGTPFLNSSPGIPPEFSDTGVNGPSIFPVTSLGLVVGLQDHAHRVLTLGLFDARAGDPAHPHAFWPSAPGGDGALLIGEAGLPIFGTGEVLFGGWAYTDRFAQIDGRGGGGSAGAHVLVQGRLSGGEVGTALQAWLRFGIASDKVRPIAASLVGGLTYGDQRRMIGLAVMQARLGDPALRAGVGDRRAETTIELTASRAFSSRFTLQPDLQYVVHPSWRSAIPDAIVAGLRFRLDWAGR